MFWTTFAVAIPDTPRFEIRETCISGRWPERGLRGRSPQRTKDADPKRVTKDVPEQSDPMENLRPLDIALMKVLQLFPDAYHAVIDEMRKIVQAGGP